MARILLSAHCGYSGSTFDFLVVEARLYLPGPLFFTGINTSLSFRESSLCRHQKGPASLKIQGLYVHGMQHLNWFDLFAYSAHPSKAKRKERGIWLRAGSVMEQARTLRSGLLGAGSALPHAIEVPITVYGGWSWGWDLNPRPEDYKSTALSN